MAYHFFAGGEGDAVPVAHLANWAAGEWRRGLRACGIEAEPVFVELDGAVSAWFTPGLCRRIAESAAPMHDELRAVFRAGADDPRGVEMF